ncbi:MAG: hypothetical protein ACYSR9_01410 [Planctomycetota bacterium]|jgi:hypothetical protein
MAKSELSTYQKVVISRYYDNLDTIMLGKLGELVTELYLADTNAKKERLWQRAQKAMKKLKVPPAIIDHIMKKRSEEILAKNLQDWLSKEKKGKKRRQS